MQTWRGVGYKEKVESHVKIRNKKRKEGKDGGEKH